MLSGLRHSSPTPTSPSLVAEIRAALGDDARQPRFVRTVQRFGYAFGHEVRLGSVRLTFRAHEDSSTATVG
jgi:DNA-binding winged helix-turn-helix (wHTH) protein